MSKWDRYRSKKINKIGFLDIETHGFGFNADDSFMVSWVMDIFEIKTKKSKMYYDIIDKKDLKYWNKKMLKSKALQKLEPYDTDILKSLVETMKECDMIVGHYSNFFDVPFVRSRCELLRIPFVKHSDKVRFADTWTVARFKYKFRRNSLDHLSRALRVNGKKTNFDRYMWVQACRYGNKKALDDILDHNIKDVKITKKLWNKIEAKTPLPDRYY